ncbi:MAG: hypothetical protein ACLF0P_08990 [Thermoanaerobaculia bacterium]
MPSPTTEAPSRVGVEPGERDLLVEEIDRIASSFTGAGTRERYARLREAVAAGAVEGELVGHLEDLLEIFLESRSVHHFHGPGPERSLLELYRRTPRGAAVEEAAATANRALEAVRGQAVEALTFRPGLPGSHRLVVETDRCRLTLEIGRSGVTARDVSV